MPTRLRTLLSAALLLLLAAPAIAGNKPEPLPYDLVIEVGYGRRPVSSGMLEELQLALIRAVESAGCFRSVRRDAPESPGADDLVLRLTVENYEDETEFRYSINETPLPGEDRRKLTTVVLLADLSMVLLTLREEIPVRTQRFSQRSSWTPHQFEDAREYAKGRMVREVVRKARSLACKGSPGKWAKQLAAARAAAGEPSSSSR